MSDSVTAHRLDDDKDDCGVHTDNAPLTKPCPSSMHTTTITSASADAMTVTDASGTEAASYGACHMFGRCCASSPCSDTVRHTPEANAAAAEDLPAKQDGPVTGHPAHTLTRCRRVGPARHEGSKEEEENDQAWTHGMPNHSPSEVNLRKSPPSAPPVLSLRRTGGVYLSHENNPNDRENYSNENSSKPGKCDVSSATGKDASKVSNTSLYRDPCAHNVSLLSMTSSRWLDISPVFQRTAMTPHATTRTTPDSTVTPNAARATPSQDRSVANHPAHSLTGWCATAQTGYSATDASQRTAPSSTRRMATPRHTATPTEVNQLRRAVRQLRAQLLAAQETSGELRRRVDGLLCERHATHTEVDELRVRLRHSEDRTAALQRSVQESRLECCALRSERDELERRLSEAWAAVARRSDRPARGVESGAASPAVETSQLSGKPPLAQSNTMRSGARGEGNSHVALRHALAALVCSEADDWASILACVARLREDGGAGGTENAKACDIRDGANRLRQSERGLRARASHTQHATSPRSAVSSSPHARRAAEVEAASDGGSRSGEHTAMNIFASEVLSLIAALDHRVSGALRQRSPVGQKNRM